MKNTATKKVLITLDGVLCDFVTPISATLMRSTGATYEEAIAQVLFNPTTLVPFLADWSFWKYLPPRLDAMRFFPILAGACATTITTSYDVPEVIIRRWLDRYGFAYRAIDLQPTARFDARVDHHPLWAQRWQQSPVVMIAYPYNAGTPFLRLGGFREVVDYCLDRTSSLPQDTTSSKGVT